MKKIALSTVLCASLAFVSCEMFQIDNYEEPQETIIGKVVDAATGEPILTDQGSEGIRVSLKELSWGENVKENPDFFCRPDGTFRNTKIFKGTYNVRIDGPFIPIYRQDADGVVTYNGTKTVDIKGVTEVNFEVEPFLRVRFDGEPQISGGVIKANVIVERAVTEEVFAAKIGEMASYNPSSFNVTDIQLFVSSTPAVGYSARDERWSSVLEYSGEAFEPLLGTSVEISSRGAIPSGHTVFIRAAARINYATYNTRRWNYSEALDVLVP